MYDEKLDKMVKEALERASANKGETPHFSNLFSELYDEDNFKTPMQKSTGYLETAPEYKEQTDEFHRVLDELFAIHRKKTADYSPWNVKGAGEQGVAVRLWDKTARLMNLMGWDIGTGTWSKPKEPKNESVDDTLMDLASYAIIMIILRRGKWGK
jgi:hypothetical protein